MEDKPEPNKDVLVAMALGNTGPRGEQAHVAAAALNAPPNDKAGAQAEGGLVETKMAVRSNHSRTT